jgi:hypothetical protein
MNWRFAIVRFSSRRNASNMPSGSRDPYPRADGSGVAIVWCRSARQSSVIFSTRPRVLRRRGAFRTGSRPDCFGRFPPSFSHACQPKRVGRLVSGRPRATPTAALWGASRVSGRTATDCGFAARSADLFCRGGVRLAALRFGPFGETRVDARSNCNAVPRRLRVRAADTGAGSHSYHAIPERWEKCGNNQAYHLRGALSRVPRGLRKFFPGPSAGRSGTKPWVSCRAASKS